MVSRKESGGNRHWQSSPRSNVKGGGEGVCAGGGGEKKRKKPKVRSSWGGEGGEEGEGGAKGLTRSLSPSSEAGAALPHPTLFLAALPGAPPAPPAPHPAGQPRDLPTSPCPSLPPPRARTAPAGGVGAEDGWRSPLRSQKWLSARASPPKWARKARFGGNLWRERT